LSVVCHVRKYKVRAVCFAAKRRFNVTLLNIG
jgi:hypothetical protein